MNWSPSEIKLLEREYRRGASYRTLAQLLQGRTYNAIDKQVRNLGLLRKYQALVEGRKMGHWDIETSGLNADFGFMISWSIKLDGGKVLHDSLNRKDFQDAGYDDPDRRIVESMVGELNDLDIVTFHFGEYFDAPFARTRALLYDQPFPEYGSLFEVDTWKLSRKLLKLHNNRLESIADYFGVNAKTKLDPAIWRRATRGDINAVEKVLVHNKRDVETLEKVYHRLEKYTPGTKRSI